MLQQFHSRGASPPPQRVESDSVSREADATQWGHYPGEVMGGNGGNTASFADCVMQLGLGKKFIGKSI